MSNCTDNREGFSFNNPNTTSDYHAPKWGLLVTPDELRYDELFGNPLISEADSQVITDDQLSDYIRLAIRYVEVELNIDILPRRVRYSPAPNSDGSEGERTDINDSDFTSGMDMKQLEELYIEEQGYKFDVIKSRQELRIKLRRRPVRNILKADFIDPFYGGRITDLMPYRIVKKGFTGVCYFRPQYLNAQNNLFYTVYNNILYHGYRRNYQRIFLIDYETGYDNAMKVPDELRNIIKKIAASTLMNIYGDGKTSAIASRSVNLNSVSESISTTLSATSAAFGARLIQYNKEIDAWFKQNRSKYSRTSIGRL